MEATVRKTFKYKLMPTPNQIQALELVLWRCRLLYNTALEERKTAWERSVSVNYYQQKAELPDLKAACPEYAEVNAQVLQDVILRVEHTYQAFFRRAEAGEKAGYPRFKGASRYHSFTYPQYGRGVVLDGSMLSLSKIGRIPIRLHRLFQGTPKTVTISRAADGWYACFSCAEAPTEPLPSTGRETGIDLGLESFATLADGTITNTLRYYYKAEACLRRCQRRVARRKKGSSRRRKAVNLLAKAHQKVKRQRRDFHHKEAHALIQQYLKIFPRNMANIDRNGL